MAVGLFIINFILLYLYTTLRKTLAKKYENDMLRRQAEAYANEAEVILQSEKCMQDLQHDLRQHLEKMQLLAEKKEYQEIETYVGRIQNELKSPEEIVTTGSGQVDSVLNYMINKAKEKGFSVKAKVQIPDCFTHSYDMNVILGNLLENAIEAGEETQEKMLNLQMCMKQGGLHIDVENSYRKNRLMQTIDGHGESTYLTSKADKSKHGIGLGNVRRIVEENNGIMEILPGENVFAVRLILYMSGGGKP